MQNKVVIFAGKGGVGKTTCAAAAALHCASLGKRTLAISTDATPSLSHIFNAANATSPVQIQDGLFISELGVREAREMWDKKFGQEVYEVFSSFISIDYQQFVDFMTSLLPGLSDEFMVDYIRELCEKREYQVIIWDTAPLGQTMALLQTPAMLSQHLKMAPRIYSKLKLGQSKREPILNIIKRWENLSADNVSFLKECTSFNMVTIPEALAVQQLDGIFNELRKHNFQVDELIINNVIKTADSKFLLARAAGQSEYLKLIYRKYANLRITEIPLLPYEVKGLERLKEIEKVLFRY